MSYQTKFFKRHGYYHGHSKFTVDQINEFKKEFDSLFNEKRQRFHVKFQGGNHLEANHDKNRWNMLQSLPR